MAKAPSKLAPIPTKQQILEFIQESDKPVGKREIAKAFHIRGDQRAELKRLLKEIENEGLIDRGRKRKLAPPGSLPEVAVLDVTGFDEEGGLLAKGTGSHAPSKAPSEDELETIIHVIDRGKRGVLVKPGDRVLARLERKDFNLYHAYPIRVLKPGLEQVLGVVTQTGVGSVKEKRLRRGVPRSSTQAIWALTPVDRKQDRIYTISGVSDKVGRELTDGDLALAKRLPRRGDDREVEVTEIIGRSDEAKAFSLIAIHKNGIPVAFADEAVAEAEKGSVPDLGDRDDLRDIPLVTIDGADARDFDDAVWACADDDPSNTGGHVLMVAIADVAAYVTPGGALDKAARQRGNSVYFPDRVVPMLPERLSNDLCSLRPLEPRACLAVRMVINAKGELIQHRFMRGLMRSAARLTYEQVQNAMDGIPDDTAGPLVVDILQPLYDAYAALASARLKRGTLELDLPERVVSLNGDGKVAQIVPRKRLDSHKLIEEFMIAANVAAAEALEAKQRAALPPIMYRVHEPPPMDKLEALRDSLAALGLNLAKGAVVKPQMLTGLLAQGSETGKGQIVSDIILRSQSQAAYRAENAGHFGLALQRYCHFTSPIRRYADLLVHRALIKTHSMPSDRSNKNKGDGLTDAEIENFDETAELISGTERRAITAERDAMDRYVAAFLADRIGAEFNARISGVQRFGCFVTLDETGADGLVPVSTLPWDRYDLDEVHHCLVGQETRLAFTLGDSVRVKLVEAAPISGSLSFEIVEGGQKAPKGAGRAARGSPKRYGRKRGGGSGSGTGGNKGKKAYKSRR